MNTNIFMRLEKDTLDKYMSEGKLPLVEPVFAKKAEVGERLIRSREARRQFEANRQRFSVRRLPLYWSAAAVVLLVITIGLYGEGKTVVNTGNDVTELVHLLPDGSNVQLMENTSVSYNRFSWKFRRSLHLDGKALFSVAPGRTFTVHTEAGEVAVLGTTFLVEQRGEELTVACKEGCVKVNTPVGQATLLAGQKVTRSKASMTPVSKDIEMPEKLLYENDPLVNVVADLTQLFQLEVKGLEAYEDLYYEGAIHLHNMEEALRSVFHSLGIPYRVEGNRLILGD